MTTDHDRITGGPAVGAVVEDLYRRLAADERVSHCFEDGATLGQARGSIVTEKT